MTIGRCVYVFLLLAAACSEKPEASRSSGVDESKPVLQPDGPLRGLGLVAERNRDGTFSEPQLSFVPDDTQVTAIVGLGDEIEEGTAVTVAWYRLIGVDDRKHLFSHEITVGPGGHAFSQGVTEGGLAPGLYETVATLGERQVRSPWVVRVAGDGAVAPAGMGGAMALLSLAGLAQPSDEDWNVPGSGDSGWYDPQEPAGDPPPPGPCEIGNIFGGMDPLTNVRGSVFWGGACSQMTLTATVSGPPQTLVSSEIPEGSLSFLQGGADVCELPGGSDMPGTIVQYTASGSDGATGTGSYTLPDLGEAIVAGLESRPEAGSRVQPGDTIDLHGLGMVMPPALGIEKLDLFAEGGLIDTVGNASGSTEPQACDVGRYFAEIVSSYRVPDDPPPVIEICAEVMGFDGHKDRSCASFYTGEVWTGTYSGEQTHDCGPLGMVGGSTLEASFTITVDADRTATFDATHTVTGSCAGPTSGTRTTPITVTGERTDSGFEFPSWFGDGGTITFTVTGNRGTGTLSGPNPSGSHDVTYDLTCSTCGPSS